MILVALALVVTGASSTVLEDIVRLPATYDPRVSNPGCLSRIVSQGNCGSCWSVSATTALSDRFCLAGDTDLNSVSDVMLSVQEPLTCVAELSSGCGGGYMVAAWRYLHNKGSATCTSSCTGGCWPYRSGSCTASNDARNNGCSVCPVAAACADRTVMTRFSAGTYGQVTAHSGLTQEVALMYEIFSNGPVQVCFNVFESFYDFFRANPTGIYSSTAGASLGGHCVRVVGWSDYQGVKYWIVANSWGTSWGESGYFKYVRGIDLAGFETWAYSGCPAGSPKACTLTFPIVGTAEAVNSSQTAESGPAGVQAGSWSQINASSEIAAKFVQKALSDAAAKEPGKRYEVAAVFAQPVEGLNVRVKLRLLGSKRSEFEDSEIEVSVHQSHLDGTIELV